MKLSRLIRDLNSVNTLLDDSYREDAQSLLDYIITELKRGKTKCLT